MDHKHQDAMTWKDAGVAVAGIAFVTVVGGIAVWRGMDVLRARVAGVQQAEYKRMAEEAIQAQKRLGDEVADLRQRMMAVEKILREVE
jgi:hypothetical protein